MKLDFGHNEQDCISLKKIYEILDLHKSQYAKWVKNNLLKDMLFQENIDYKSKILNKHKGNQKTTDYLLTIECAICLIKKIRNRPYSSEVLLYLEKYYDNTKKIIIKHSKRKELEFKEKLEKITGLKWESQYTIPNQYGGKYRLDFYLKKHLIVEYDEIHHNYQALEDDERIQWCVKWLAINETNGHFVKVIRINENNEFEGLHLIIKYLFIDKNYDFQGGN